MHRMPRLTLSDRSLEFAQTLVRMNTVSDRSNLELIEFARDHLAGRTGAAEERGLWGKLLGPDLGRLAWQHLGLVLASVLAAVAIGVPLAVAVAGRPEWRAGLLAVVGICQTVPSLAMLAVLIWALGRIGTVPALVALTLYALLPIVRNTCTGLAEVPAGLKQAATALGLRRGQVRWQIELPLALPTLVAGVRTATVIGVGTATLAAFIGAGGFGERIVTGLALNDNQMMLAGALPSAALALLFEGAFELAERLWLHRRGAG